MNHTPSQSNREERIRAHKGLMDEEGEGYIDASVSTLLAFIDSEVSQTLADQREQETVVCSAVIADDGMVYRGHRHGHCFQAIRDEGKKEMSSADSQGFITTRNRFVTRKEARLLQDTAGIESVDKDGYRSNTLFSEDLYQHHKDGIIATIPEGKRLLE